MVPNRRAPTMFTLHRPSLPVCRWLLVSTLLIALWATMRPHSSFAQSAVDWNPAQAELYESDAVMIKFKDTAPMRLRNGRPVNVEAEVQSAGIAAIHALAAGGLWTRGHDVSEAALDDLRAQGRMRTGQQPPDLNNYHRLELPPGMDIPTALAQFGAHPEVEWVGPIPKPVGTPVVPDLVAPGGITGDIAADRYQKYLDPAPDGIDARWAWYGINGSGAGVQICDLEKNLNPNHGDLSTVKVLTPGPNPVNDDNHGTAVLGILGSVSNGFGITGIAHKADLLFAATTSTQGFSLEGAITRCATNIKVGDIIVIEAQTVGPNTKDPKDRAWSSEGLVPVEWYKPAYDAIVSATAAGRIVLEAGSNGAEDLDSADYQTGNGGHHPFKPANDSGAILVGAGNSPYSGATARAPSWFTNTGATMDLQGWGDGIVTTGYGDLHPGNADPNDKNLWYKESFGGTSGATPIVAGAAAVLQSEYRAVNGTSATAAQLRTLLRTTGTAQAGTGNIGPLPNLKDALVQLYAEAGVLPTVAPPVLNPAAGTYNMPLQATIGYGAGQSGSNTNIRYTLNGDEPNEDSFIFIPEQGDTLYLNYGVTLKARAFVRDNDLGRTVESPVVTATYVSSTPKVATPVITPLEGSYNQGTQFTLSTTTPGATIRYRTDGRSISFFYPGTEYTGPITLDAGEYEITARGYKDGYYKSDMAFSGPVTINAIQIPTPTIYPNGGNFTGQATVYMGSTVLGAEIRYTLDGSEPTASSSRYEEPITLTPDDNEGTITVKARVFLAPYTPSAIVEKTFNILAVVNPPQIDTNQENDEDFATITMTAQSGVTIRYTTNGAEPTSYSTIYTGPFTLTPGTYTVKAKGFSGTAAPSSTTNVEIAVANNTEPITDPVLNPFSTRNYVEPFTVTMQTATPGAIIRYTVTTDGSIAPDPTAPGQAGAQTYSAPLGIETNGQYRYKARAYKDNGAGGFNSSNVIATGTFELSDPLGAATVPTIDPPGGLFTDTVEVTFSGAQFEGFWYTLDGSEPIAGPPAEPPTQQGNGFTVVELDEPTTVRVKAYRPFFSASDDTLAEFRFVCATPTATAGGAHEGSVNVTMESGTPDAAIRYTLDGSEPSASSTLYTDALNITQTTTLKAKCFRGEFEPSTTITELYVIEAAPETPQVIDQPEDQTVDAGQTVTLSVDTSGTMTNTTAYQWQFNGSDLAGEVEPNLEIPSAQPGNAGDYRVIVRARGGAVTSQSATVSVNDVAVSGLLAESDGPTILGDPTNFAASVAAGGEVSYGWEFGDGSNGSGPNPGHTYAAAGSYTVVVTATNSVNRVNANLTVQVRQRGEAVSDLSAESTSPSSLGEATLFFATVGAGTDVVYTWDFGDGNTGAGPNPIHTYAAVGNYTVNVTAANSVNSLTAELTVPIIAGAQAISGLDAASTSPVSLGEAMTFFATTDAGTSVVYTWNLGDGNMSTGARVTHLYAAVGTYTVTVRASNSLGTAQETLTVEVRNIVVEPGLSIYLPYIVR